MKCPGLHCSHGSHGGGGAVLAVVVALILIGAIGKAAGKAVAEAGHVLSVVLNVLLITVTVVAAAAVLAALGWAGLRVHRWRSARAACVVPVVQLAEVVSSEPLAIEPPRARLTGTEDLLPGRARREVGPGAPGREGHRGRTRRSDAAPPGPALLSPGHFCPSIR